MKFSPMTSSPAVLALDAAPKRADVVQAAKTTTASRRKQTKVPLGKKDEHSQLVALVKDATLAQTTTAVKLESVVPAILALSTVPSDISCVKGELLSSGSTNKACLDGVAGVERKLDRVLERLNDLRYQRQAAFSREQLGQLYQLVSDAIAASARGNLAPRQGQPQGLPNRECNLVTSFSMSMAVSAAAESKDLASFSDGEKYALSKGFHPLALARKLRETAKGDTFSSSWWFKVPIENPTKRPRVQ